MRLERVVTMPGFAFGGRVIIEPKTQWRACLNKREADTLQRAAKILRDLRALAAGDDTGHGDDALWEVPGGEDLTIASTRPDEWLEGGTDQHVTSYADPDCRERGV